MRTKPETHTWTARAVLLISCLSIMLGANLVAQPGPDTGGGTGGTNGVPEAPINGLYYARLNAAWKDFAPGLYSMQADAPQDGGYYARSDNLWKQIQSTVTGGTLDVLVAAAAEFQPDGLDGTLVPSNSAVKINLNHIYDPSGLITTLDQTNRTFRVQTGRYSVTVVVPVCLQGSGAGNNRVPYTIGLWDVQAGTNIYYSTYTLYDEDRSQITSVFMPIFDALGDKDYAIRIVNLDTEQALVCGLDNEIAGLQNHYTEVSVMKLSGAVSLPATEWAVENLLVNTALEAGTVGQAIGYTAAGEVGVVSLGTGGGGRTDVVIGQDTVADLTNNVVIDLNGIERAIVSNHRTNRAEYYQVQFDGAPWPEPFAGGWGSTYVNNGDGTHTITQPTDAAGGIRSSATTILPPNRIKLGFEAKGTVIDISGTSFRISTSYGINAVWQTSDTITTTNWTTFIVEYDMVSATGLIDLEALYPSGESITFRNLLYAPAGGGLLWSKLGDIYPDAPADGQTYGRQDGAWVVVTGGGGLTSKTVDIPAVNYQFVPDTDVIVINSTTPFTTGDYVFTGEPIILPGVDGQYLTITNLSNADLQFTRGPSFGIYCASSLFTIASDIKFDQNYVGYFRFNGPTGQWDAIGGWPIVSLLEVTALPAPWEPPDADGNQVIRDSVQDALIDALLPRLLQRIGPSAGTMPAPAPAPRRLGAPGTRGNPIDWPAAAAADDTGKYSININIGDQ